LNYGDAVSLEMGDLLGITQRAVITRPVLQAAYPSAGLVIC